MLISIFKRNTSFLFLVAVFLLSANGSLAQTTSEFTYQGRLLDNNLPASAQYDIQFALWHAVIQYVRQEVYGYVSQVVSD